MLIRRKDGRVYDAMMTVLPMRDADGELIGCVSTHRDISRLKDRVRDNGRGIAEQDMDKVFTPFRRAGHQDVPGEGMGLAYVQTLVRRHGGRVWCESEPGVGATFAFTISNYLRKGENIA